MATTTSDTSGQVVEDVERPPVTIDAFYGLITLGSSTLWAVLSGWLLYFYQPPDGQLLVPAARYSAALLITRIFNALATPFIGYWSDHVRTRWGRRLPFVFASGLPLLVFFVMIWTPPVQGESTWNLVYLVVVLAFYNLAYSFNQIPYTALLPELALTDHHRVRISAWTSSFFLVGMSISALAGPLIERVGYSGMALSYAILGLPLFYLPFLVLRERPGRYQSSSKGWNFLDDLRDLFRNRAFVVMSLTGIFFWSTSTFVQSVVPYIVTEICLLEEGDTLYFYGPALLVSLLCYPLITWLADRFGKWRVFAGSLLASAVVLPGLMLIGDWLPLSLRAQGVVWISLQAAVMSGVTMLPPAFGAEIADHGAELTGERREGTYYATWGLLDQIINGVAFSAIPLLLLLGRSHTDPRGPLGVRLVGLIGGVMMFAGFLVFLKYPLRGRRITGTLPEAEVNP